MSQVGRPSLFTPERRQALLNAISKHVPYEIAAIACGVSPRRLWEWIAIGNKDIDEEKITDFAAFSQALKEVEQTKIINHTEAIEDCPERWQAKAWLLERRWNQHFGANAELREFQRQLDEMRDILEKDNGKA